MPDVVHRCCNAVQRGTTWPCTLTAYVACMRCVCVCVLHVSPWFAQPGRSLGLLLGETEQREHRKKKKTGRQETPNRNTSELWHILHIFTSHHINFTSTSSGEWHPAAPTQSRSPPIAIQGAAFGIRDKHLEIIKKICVWLQCLIAK